MLIGLNACRFEHTWPIDPMGLQDIFGNNMLCAGPEPIKEVTVRIIEC